MDIGHDSQAQLRESKTLMIKKVGVISYVNATSMACTCASPRSRLSAEPNSQSCLRRELIDTPSNEVPNVRFSNRPIGVKRFQTIHQSQVLMLLAPQTAPA